MIEYPSSFPRSSRDKVETAIAKAEMDFAANQRSVVLFVLGIFEVFLWEFTEVVFNHQPERLSAEIFRRDTRQFLDGLIEQVHTDKPPSALRRQKTSLLPGDITYTDFSEGTDLESFRVCVLQKLAQFPFWTHHQHNIQALSPDDAEASDVGATGREVVEPAPPKSVDFAWEDVTIRFANRLRAQVTIGGDLQPPQGYKELGFMDAKTKNPNSAWKALQELARLGGTINTPPKRCKWARDWTAVKKRMEEVRQILCEAFKTDADPVPFVHGIGYRVAFKIDPDSDLDH